MLQLPDQSCTASTAAGLANSFMCAAWVPAISALGEIFHRPHRHSPLCCPSVALQPNALDALHQIIPANDPWVELLWTLAAAMVAQDPTQRPELASLMVHDFFTLGPQVGVATEPSQIGSSSLASPELLMPLYRGCER